MPAVSVIRRLALALTPALLVLMAGCFDEDPPLRGSLRSCVDDNACPIGEVCDPTQAKCVVFDVSDGGPRPADSTQLIERLGSLVFNVPDQDVASGDAGLVAVELTVLDKHKLTLSQAMRSGTVRSRVSDGKIRLWSLRLGSAGGGVSLVDATSGEVRAYVVDMTITSSAEMVGDLIADEYPHAHFSAPGRIVVTANVGSTLDDLHPIELTFEEASIDGSFDLDGNVLIANVALADQLVFDGAQTFFRIDKISISAHFHGARVPDSWTE